MGRSRFTSIGMPERRPAGNAALSDRRYDMRPSSLPWFRSAWLGVLLLLGGSGLLAQKSEGGAASPMADPLDPAVLSRIEQDAAPVQAAAEQALQSGDARKAALLYIWLCERRPGDPLTLYNLACCYGRLGKADLAARVLRRAVDAGLEDLNLAKKDPDFDSVRSERVFRDVLDEMASRSASRGPLVWVESRRLMPCRLRIPPSYRPGTPLPLVVAIHGRGATAADFARIWEALDDPACILAVPEAPYELVVHGRKGFSWDFPVQNPKLWDVADPMVAEDILGVARTVARQYTCGPVYLLAHSQGCAYAFLAAMRHPDQVKGVVLFGGVLPREMLREEDMARAAGKVRVFWAHGRADAAVPFSQGEKARDDLLGRKFDVTFVPFEGGHELLRAPLQRAFAWMGAGR